MSSREMLIGSTPQRRCLLLTLEGQVCKKNLRSKTERFGLEFPLTMAELPT